MAIRRDGESIDGPLAVSIWYNFASCCFLPLTLDNKRVCLSPQGSWKGGNQDGWGLKRWGDSSSYEGEWSEGQKHGKGVYSWIGIGFIPNA